MLKDRIMQLIRDGRMILDLDDMVRQITFLPGWSTFYEPGSKNISSLIVKWKLDGIPPKQGKCLQFR